MDYCASCGGKLALTEIKKGEPHRHVCSSCGRVHYQNPVPTAGALIVQDEKLLLVRRGEEPCKGMWDIPGGFLEKDEHPEVALLRELREELGVEGRPGNFLGIFMGTYNETTTSTLNIYYEAQIVGEPHADSDVAAIEWFALNALPDVAFTQNRKAIDTLLKLYGRNGKTGKKS